MRLLLVGDLHGTDKTPEHRVDNYAKAWMDKFAWILKTYAKEKCEGMIQPGDFFDSPNTSYAFFEQTVRMINQSGAKILTVYGQHDLRYRTKTNCSLTALSASCPALILGKEGSRHKVKDTVFHFSGWEESIPKPSLKTFNILIIHKMIVDTKLWSGQEDFEYGESFLDKHRFDLIVSGDNHQTFIVEKEGRYLINCGSMMRSSIKQIHHKPVLFIFDTKDRRLQKIEIPALSFDTVFRLEEAVKTKERNEKLETFIQGLTYHKDIGLSFTENLFSYMKNNGVEESIQNLFRRMMDERYSK